MKAHRKGGRKVNRLAAVFGLVVVFVIGSTLSASAADLTGETFTWAGAGTNGSFFCNLSTGTMSYSVIRGGVAAGPFVGTFTENGNITFGGGLVTGWTASFKIKSSSGATLVTGTKALVAGGGGPATCNPGGPSCLVPMTGDASGQLTYTTTLPTAGTGPSSAILHGVLGCNDDVTGSTFSEVFAVPIQPGCNPNTNSQGNDDCDQTGNH
jgi:hypothetical protein